jgi:membrane peptidoglycan carboxypeptidase
MQKRNSPDRPRRTSPAAPASKRRPTAITLLALWPFLLFNLVTRPVRSPLRLVVRLLGHPILAGIYALSLIALVYGLRAQRYDLSRIHSMPERSLILDRQRVEIGRIHGEKRSVIPLHQVSEDFRKAILAREDERFYDHGAIDPLGIIRAAIRNFQGKRQGASTLTQQLASDVFQLKRGEKRGQHLRQIDRKLLEIAIAFRIESWLDKDEIFQAYINQINWGRQIKGISEAARIYFEKHPSELNLSESAVLAGIIRGPDAFNPFKSIEASFRERDTTLDRMVAANAITPEQAEEAKLEPIEIRPEWRRKYEESYVMDAVRRELEVLLEKENIELGGLTIVTTFDMRLQKVAEEALDKKLREIERIPGYPHRTRSKWLELPEDQRGEPDYLQGSVVVVENRTGAVLALVGGRDANESRFNRALQSRRQVGSIFKPFIYLSAFERGLRPTTAISDGRIQPGEIRGGGRWRPRNADGVYGGFLPAADGLIRSRNTMSVRIGNFAGMDNIREVAAAAGFTATIPSNPSSFLGSWDASPWEVASAYSMFPNEGIRYRPYLISEIKDRDGNRLYPKEGNPQLAYESAPAGPTWTASKVLQDVVTRGTAASVRRLGFDKPCAGKTGTTNDFRDAWFAGYTSSLTASVWVGFDKPKKTIQGGYGSVLALPVWVDVIRTADRLGYTAGTLHSDRKLVIQRVCTLSGKLATEGCEANGNAYDDSVPSDQTLPPGDFCPHHPAKAVPILEDEAAPPQESPPPRALRVNPSSASASPPRRALPVREAPPPKAIPVREPELPRALPVE